MIEPKGSLGGGIRPNGGRGSSATPNACADETPRPIDAVSEMIGFDEREAILFRLRGPVTAPGIARDPVAIRPAGPARDRAAGVRREGEAR